MQVILISAQSADGFITRHDQPGSGFASAADRAYFQKALAVFDSSIMGSATFRVSRTMILGSLTRERKRFVLTREPEKYTGDAAQGMLEFTSEAPRNLVERMKGEGHRRCALLGGARTHSLFLEAGLVSELWLTVEPRLFGAGVPFLRAPIDVSMRLFSHERLDGSDTLLLRYALR
jgi:riboflavin biosynthesis pyrimidine reductase